MGTEKLIQEVTNRHTVSQPDLFEVGDTKVLRGPEDLLEGIKEFRKGIAEFENIIDNIEHEITWKVQEIDRAEGELADLREDLDETKGKINDSIHNFKEKYD